ncbi:toprim domain-containing protein [Hymenobacter terricola]|uniref:toprim domain-containing protein n=1 Tax=Hymenobacter terricola TaxID=2819236 RepID=UPI001B3123AE|nr:toprim domain-containing protein [Hymenobacter terricola]
MATTTLSSAAARAADKKVSILSFMAKLGHQPIGQAAGGNYYFLSPLREEKTASFVVSEPKNLWADYGETPRPGQKVAGGNVLDLVMRIADVTLPVARLMLRAWSTDLPDFVPARPTGVSYTEGPRTFTDVRTEKLAWPPLITYLTERGINWRLVQRSEQTMATLQQIFYRVDGQTRDKPYFGLGWKTAAGWEVRNPRFQGTIGGKGLTWLKGAEAGVMVFEGFMDYLSALTHYETSFFRSRVLVLNSVSLVGQALPELMEAPVVHWFGDNDAAGLKALDYLRQTLPAGRVQAHNDLYRGYKDFNDFLTKTRPTKPLPPRGAVWSKLSVTQQYWLWVVFKKRERGTKYYGRTGKCAFYCHTNDAAGLEELRVLRNRMGHQLDYYRICERTTGRQYKILEWAGQYNAKPVVPGYVPPVFDESDEY